MAFKHNGHMHENVIDARTCEALAIALKETCEHGLSAWLCEGPQHYWMDDMERQARGW